MKNEGHRSAGGRDGGSGVTVGSAGTGNRPQGSWVKAGGKAEAAVDAPSAYRDEQQHETEQTIADDRDQGAFTTTRCPSVGQITVGGASRGVARRPREGVDKPSAVGS